MLNKVVVIGRNYTSRLGMIRALGRAGYQVYVICTNRRQNSDIDKKSKYVCGYYSAKEPDQYKLIDTINAIGKRLEGNIFLIPVDDFAASTIDNHLNLLKNRFLFPNVCMRQGAVNDLMDKNTQKQLALKAGLNVAKGWVVEVKNGQYTLPPNIVYPCFPKPEISYMGTKQYMRKCSTESELRTVLDRCASLSDCPILVEQYIEIEKELGVLGVCDRGHAVLPGLVDKLMIGEGAHKGVTKLGEVKPLINESDLKKKLQTFLSYTQFTGLCDIDLYESNGNIYFNELNLRFGAFGYSILCAGANLPAHLIKTLLDLPTSEEVIKIRPRTICLSEKVNLDDYRAGYYGWHEYKNIHEKAECYFLADREDPRPYTAFRKQVFLSLLKKIVIKTIRWH